MRHRLQGHGILDPLATGSLFALVAVLSMHMGVEFKLGMILDARAALVMLAGPFGSVGAALVAGLLTAAHRLYLGGVAAPAGCGMMLSAAALGIFWIWLKLPRPGRWLPLQLLAMGLALVPLGMAWTLALPASFDYPVFLTQVVPPMAAFFALTVLVVGLFLSYTDERRLAQAALNSNERLLRTVIETSTDGIYVKDREGRYQLINRAGAALLDSTPEAMVGHTDGEISDSDTAKAFMANDRRALNGGEAVQVEEVAAIAGESRTFFSMKAPYRGDEGQVAGLVGVSRDITERARNESALRDSEIRYRSLFEQAGTAIYILEPESRRIIGANEHGGRWLGYSRDQILKLNFADIEAKLPGGFLEAAFQQLLAQGEVIFEHRLRHRNGDVLPAEINARLVEIEGRQVAQALVRDISERKQGEQALRDSVERYQALFDHATDPIVVIDPTNHRLIEVNAVAAKVLGYDRQELTGLDLDDLVGENSAGQITATIDDVLISGAAHFETSMRCQDGSLLPIEASVQAVEVQGRMVLQAFLRDISERREMAEQLGRALRLEAVGRLTGGVAHDFNNILTIIITNLHFLTEELEEGVVDEKELRVMVDAALEAATRGSDVTHRLLAFSRQESLQPQTFDLAKLITDTARLLAPALGETVKLETHIADDLAPPYADRGHLQNALVNLAVNSRDAMKDGGTLTIEAANAVLGPKIFSERRGARPGDYVMVAVHDSGSGIAAETLERIFEPFFTTKDKSTNSGLGLSMVHGFAMQSAGHIEVESEVGSGTSIRLFLPQASEIERNDMAAEPSRDMPGGSERVLLVEDEEAVRRSLSQSLVRLGYTVIEAADGPQALDIVEAEDFDLLVTDLVMPGGLSGLELVRETRVRRPATKVLFISGYAEALERLGDVLEPGDRYLSKPFRQSQLATTLRQVLEAD